MLAILMGVCSLNIALNTAGTGGRYTQDSVPECYLRFLKVGIHYTPPVCRLDIEHLRDLY